MCRQLLSGELRPGDRVSELALAENTGVSRSPVREALVQLRAEGLLDHTPNLGSFVKAPDRSLMGELYALRQWLEGGAAAHLAGLTPRAGGATASNALGGSPAASTQPRAGAAGSQTAPDLAPLTAVNEQILSLAREFYRAGPYTLSSDMAARLARLDSEFHLLLVTAAANRPALKSLVHALMLIRLGRHDTSDPRTREHLARLYTDHDLILRAIRHGDAAEAFRLAGEHVIFTGRSSGDLPDATPSDPLRDQALGAGPRGRSTADLHDPLRVLLTSLDAPGPGPRHAAPGRPPAPALAPPNSAPPKTGTPGGHRP